MGEGGVGAKRKSAHFAPHNKIHHCNETTHETITMELILNIARAGGHENMVPLVTVISNHKANNKYIKTAKN